MRTVTTTKRIGEFLGPVDWSYDFNQYAWGTNGAGINPACVAEGVEVLRKMDADPVGWRITSFGFSSFEVVFVGMYDGWPFWRPTPHVGYIGPMGSVEWTPFYDLRHDRVSQRKEG